MLELDDETRLALGYSARVDLQSARVVGPKRRASRAKARVVERPPPPKFDGRHRRNWRHKRLNP
jgi:hypothetical protein